jgi:hypothetical protein
LNPGKNGCWFHFAGPACGYQAGNVPIRTFLEHDHSFGPEDIAGLSAAFDAALSKLGLVDRTDLATLAIAKLIIELAKEGERDPERLCALALKHIKIRP